MKIVPKPSHPAIDEKPWGCLKEVCLSRGIKYSSGRYAVANGLPAARVGRAIYVKYEDFDRWLASRLERVS